MSKKVLVISTSLRRNSNSFRLAQEFARGAKDAGHEVELVSLIGREIGYCVGCFACQTTGQCIIEDDANLIEEKMLQADIVAYATPIYYYEMAGQMKNLLDRMNPLFPKDYTFRDIYFLSSAAEDEEGTDARAISGLEGWIDCFEKAQLAGSVFAGGVTAVGDIQGHKALQEAYEMGRNA